MPKAAGLNNARIIKRRAALVVVLTDFARSKSKYLVNTKKCKSKCEMGLGTHCFEEHVVAARHQVCKVRHDYILKLLQICPKTSPESGRRPKKSIARLHQDHQSRLHQSWLWRVVHTTAWQAEGERIKRGKTTTPRAG